MKYKEEQKKYRELTKAKFYPKGYDVPDTVYPDGSVSHFLNGYPAPKNDYEIRHKPQPKVYVGTNHERHLARQEARKVK